MPRRRIVVALLFTAAGITPLAALGAAWGEQQPGWTSESTVTVSGKAADSFPATAAPSRKPPALVAAPVAPGSATQAAAVPQAVEPATTATATAEAPTGDAKPDRKPTGKPSQSKPAHSEPTKPVTPPASPAPAHSAPTGEPTEGSN